MIGAAAHDHQPRPPYAREAQTLSISVVPPVLHWQWLLHRTNWQPSACMYVYSLCSLALSPNTLLWWAISVSVTTITHRGGYSRTEQVGGLDLSRSGAVRRCPQIYSLSSTRVYMSLSSNESASDISIQSVTPVSRTVDSRYPKNSIIIIVLSNHQQDEL